MGKDTKYVDDLRVGFKKLVERGKSEREILRRLSLVIGAYLHSLLIIWPVLRSAFSGDDTVDSMVPMQLNYSDQSTWSYISQYTSNWARNEGRFFPGAATIGMFAHYLFTERAEYKIVQMLFVLAALTVFGIFVAKLFRSIYYGVVSVLILNISMQMRVQYDALFQFSLQQPSVVILLFTSFTLYLSGLRKSKKIELFLAATTYLIAMLTYESTVLLWPIFPLILVMERPKKYRMALATTLFFPTVVVLNLVRLRDKAVSNTAGYVSNFDGVVLIKTFLKQAVGSIPMSYAEIRTPGFLERFPQHLHPGSILWLTAIGTSIVVASIALRRCGSLCHRQNLYLVLIGFIMWAVPALVVAQTVRWQQELTIGNSYITVFQSSFGFGLVVIGLISEVKLLVSNSGRLLPLVLSFVLVVVTAIATSSVITNNPRAVAQFNPGYLWPRETFERSIRFGVFGGVPFESKVLGLNREWWFNAPFVLWFGGPKLTTLDSPMNVAEWGNCIFDAETCLNRQGYSYMMTSYGRYPSEPRVIVVGKAVMMAGKDGIIEGAQIASPRIFIDYPTKSNSLTESKGRCLGWGKERVGRIYGSIDEIDVTVLESDESSCLLGFSDEVSFDLYQFTVS